ncbi:hypothetical protein YC2023_066001 [Brassica napus]
MTSVGVCQHTQDVCGCLWLSVSTHRMSVAVRVCPCVSVSTHMTSLAVHQYTYQHVGPWTHHAGPSRGLFGTSVAVRQHTQDVRGCPCVYVSTHTGHLWLSVAVRQHTLDVSGCPSVHISARTHRTYVGVRQHTQDVRGCPSAHTGRPWQSVCVRVCPQHTHDVHGCPSVHISARWPFPWTVWVILAHVGCLFSTHMTSVGVCQHTKDVRGCPCVSVSTHRTSVAVHQYTYQHAGPWTQHAGPSRGVFGDFGQRGLSVHYTQDVCGCPTLVLGLSTLTLHDRLRSTDQYMEPNQPGDQNVLNISTEVHDFHRTGQIDRAVYWTVPHTSGTELCLEPWPDDRSDHTGACLSRPTSHLKTYARARIHFGRARRADTYLGELDELSELSDTTLELDELSELNDTSLELNELSNTEDGAGSAAGRNGPVQPKEKFIKSSLWDCFFPNSTSHFLSPFQAHSHQEYQEGVSKEVLFLGEVIFKFRSFFYWTVHINLTERVILILVLSLPMDCSGDFGLRELSVQHTQDVRGCSSAHTGRPCVSVSTHRTSVCVRQHTQDVCSCPCVSVCVR